MSDVRDPDRDQPLPIPTDGPSIHDLVIRDLEERKAQGARKYGRALQAYNGRDAVQDALEEAMDLAVYLRQLLEEREGEKRYLMTRWRTMRAAAQAPGTGQWRDGYLCALADLMRERGMEMPKPVGGRGFFDWRDDEESDHVSEQDDDLRASDASATEDREVSGVGVREDLAEAADFQSDLEPVQHFDGDGTAEDGGGDHNGAGSAGGQVGEGAGVLRSLRPEHAAQVPVTGKALVLKGGTRYRQYTTYKSVRFPGRTHIATYDKLNKDYSVYCRDKFTYEWHGFLRDDDDPVAIDCVDCRRVGDRILAGKWGLGQ